jgi:hypothetical protein
MGVLLRIESRALLARSFTVLDSVLRVCEFSWQKTDQQEGEKQMYLLLYAMEVHVEELNNE